MGMERKWGKETIVFLFFFILSHSARFDFLTMGMSYFDKKLKWSIRRHIYNLAIDLLLQGKLWGLRNRWWGHQQRQHSDRRQDYAAQWRVRWRSHSLRYLWHTQKEMTNEAWMCRSKAQGEVWAGDDSLTAVCLQASESQACEWDHPGRTCGGTHGVGRGWSPREHPCHVDREAAEEKQECVVHGSQRAGVRNVTNYQRH